jgi:hypothetical protein
MKVASTENIGAVDDVMAVLARSPFSMTRAEIAAELPQYHPDQISRALRNLARRGDARHKYESGEFVWHATRTAASMTGGQPTKRYVPEQKPLCTDFRDKWKLCTRDPYTGTRSVVVLA